MADLNVSHCSLSACETQPGYCEDHLSVADTILLCLIIVTPLLIALLAPLIARGEGAMCSHDDDSPLSPVWTRVDVPLDPPMYLCGVGLLPLDCGLSGLLTVVMVMACGFVVIFFSMLSTERPCTTGLGMCRTISCICGNLLPEGYVFMFCMLSITSVILVQRISRMAHHHRIQHRIIKPVLIAGSLMLTLTGIFPERYDANNTMSGYLLLLYYLHLLGVFGSGALLLLVPFAWFAEHWWTHRDSVPLRSLLPRLAYVLAVLAFSIAMTTLASDSVVRDEVQPFCSVMTSQSECDSWPRLNAANCTAALQCVHQPAADGCEAFIQPNFRCRWLPSVGLDKWTQILGLLAPPAPTPGRYYLSPSA